eukprot:2486433-Pyramimonas_sp.AAC.2
MAHIARALAVVGHLARIGGSSERKVVRVSNLLSNTASELAVIQLVSASRVAPRSLAKTKVTSVPQMNAPASSGRRARYAVTSTTCA